MFWRKKEKERELPQESTFSTDIIPMNKRARMAAIADAIQRNFVVPKFNPVDVNGNTVAMDSVNDSSMQLTKYRNNYAYTLPESQFLWYSSQGFIGWQTAALLSQNWLIEKACAMPARDASRHGYELTVNDGEEADPKILDYIRQRDDELEIAKNLVEFIRMGRIFGIRVALYIVDSPDKDYYTKPFNIDGVRPGSYKGISQIDPYWITPELDAESAANPASKHFYEPTWWRINGVRVHRTHLCIYREGELPDILKPAYLYGGIPIPQKIAERVYAAERTANEAPLLAMTKRMTVMNTDLTQALSNQSQFESRMQQWTTMMNNFGVKLVGGKDKIEQFDTSLADLDETIMTQFQLVAAASGVPATKLMGTAPKGFNATGEYDEKSYHEELESIQQHALDPLLFGHHLRLMRSEVEPKFKSKFSLTAKWRPTNALTAKERAEVNKLNSDTDANLANIGAIDGYDVRERLISDENSGYNGVESIGREDMQAASEQEDDDATQE